MESDIRPFDRSSVVFQIALAGCRFFARASLSPLKDQLRVSTKMKSRIFWPSDAVSCRCEFQRKQSNVREIEAAEQNQSTLRRTELIERNIGTGFESII
jgi:hypothetical protein